MNIQQRVSDHCEFEIVNNERKCHGHTEVSDEELNRYGEEGAKDMACQGCMATCKCNGCWAEITVENGVRTVIAHAKYTKVDSPI